MRAFETYSAIKANIEKTIAGKGDVIDLLISALFSGGHVLLEDVPGTGKTTLARALALSIDGDFKRIQFTPDLLPSDIVGINFFDMKTSEFRFMAGPVFTNILLADEINRATPKTQAGLLECMQERTATVDGTTYGIPDPFMVVATQNPVESMGTYPLPEAQLDRFIMKISVGYPDYESAVDILRRFGKSAAIKGQGAVVSLGDVRAAIAETADVYCNDDLLGYITAITQATRRQKGVVLGAGPRAALALLSVSKALAVISGRNYVLPDDIKRASPHVLCHRIILSGSEMLKNDSRRELIMKILDETPVPTESVFDGRK